MNEPNYIPCTPQRWDATIQHRYADIVFKGLDQTDVLYFLRLLQRAEWANSVRVDGDTTVVAEIKPSVKTLEAADGES